MANGQVAGAVFAFLTGDEVEIDLLCVCREVVVDNGLEQGVMDQGLGS